MNLFDKFFLERFDLLESFQAFDTKHRLGILKSLREETDETQFLSLVTEINFGTFFDNFCSSVAYEKSYGKFTPDWTFKMNDQDIVAEVLRLNPSASDKAVLDFDNTFMNAIHEIKIGCFLSFDHDEINRDSIDIEKCKNLVEKWLNRKPEVNEAIRLPGGY